METRGISREGTASQARWESSQVYDVPHTTSPSRQPGGHATRGALRAHTAVPPPLTPPRAGCRRHQAVHGDPPTQASIRCPKSGGLPPPPAPALSAPRAPSTASAPPLRAAEPPLRDPAGGWVPPQPSCPLFPRGAPTSSRSDAGTCRASPHSPLRRRTTTTPEPA